MHLYQYPDKEYKIRFDRMKPKGICGLAEDGHEVYIDRSSPYRPELGEVWYCQLLKKETLDNHYYFAMPIYRAESECKSKIDAPLSEKKTELSQSLADSPEGESVDAAEGNEHYTEFIPELTGFVAIGDDTIYSPRLTAARYTVYRNFTGDRFELIPDNNGDIECVRNSIRLESLDDLLDCETPVRLTCDWSEERIMLSLIQ